MYRIGFSDLAKKQFLKLPKDAQERIKNTLIRIRIRPFSYVKKIVGIPRYSLRIEKYRLILNLERDRLIVLGLEEKQSRD